MVCFEISLSLNESFIWRLKNPATKVIRKIFVNLHVYAFSVTFCDSTWRDVTLECEGFTAERTVLKTNRKG